ncbi:hypothetical protein [Motilimonas pumila]|uniref:DUF2189 domain-containing protein n=1 Tax=Motilimonas pumila TaxID=2303987 RepID=A0A418YAZ3_9GAMM|nr:hypothetical protein [Motilimonas pumila]RJG40144.1 hypothetical protein D1Z90_17005 [Motilimonas pumila]
MNQPQKLPQIEVGGNLQKSLEQGFRLDLKKVLSESLQLTVKNLGVMLLAGIAALGLMMLVSSLAISFAESMGFMPEQLDEEGNPVIFTKPMMVVALLIGLFALPPLTAGFTMMAINHVVGLKSKATMVFDFYKLTLPLATAFIVPNLLSGLIMNQDMITGVSLGSLVYIPSIYISAVFAFTMPLMLERKIPVFQALPLAAKLAHKNIGQLFILHAIINFAMLFGIVTLVGIAFAAPFAFTLQAVIYREVCGIRLRVEVNQDSDKPGTSNSSDDDDQDKGQFSA